MSYAPARQGGVPHTVFLRRLAGARSAVAVDARLSQGAFLALRLVDLLEYAHPVYADAFYYQHAATGRFCRELPVDHTETAHLGGLIANAADAFRHQDVRLVAPALVAYAHYLEDELRLDEALDVLDTVLGIGRGTLATTDTIAVHLRLGRVNRKLNRFDAAERAYDAARALAREAGDVHSALLGVVGRAISTQARGNLAEAERLFRELAVDAREARDHDVEARAHHALGTTLLLRGQVGDGIVQVWRAFQGYEDEASRLRALNDLGVMLLALGRVADAERALGEVVRRGGARDNTSNALIELMHCASYRRDRMGFERWRAECQSRAGEMPPNILADFYLKAGIGSARFGNFRKAETLMQEALHVAAQARLHESEFRIERIRTGLHDCDPACGTQLATAAEPATSTEDVREVSAALARFDA